MEAQPPLPPFLLSSPDISLGIEHPPAQPPALKSEGPEDMHHFEITMGETCADAVVMMDGKVVTGLKSFSVDCGIHDIPRITLELEVAKTSLLSGRAQVWVRETTSAAEKSVDTANHRADVAEARADAAESVLGPQGGTLAYIVPVDGSTLDTTQSKDTTPTKGTKP